jgi:hypothetical protein
MKLHSILCIAIACTLFKPVQAQIEKGKWIGGITLDGRKYKVDSYGNNNGVRNYTGEYIESQFSSSVIINKILSKKWMIGAGLTYNRSLNRSYAPPPLSASSSSQSVTETFGFVVQGSYFKELFRNVYLSQVLQLGYNDFFYVGRGNYRYPNETKIEQNGYEIEANIMPLQLGYLYKKRFLLSLNIASFKYKNSIREPGLPEESTIKLLTYSFNPFKNGFTISYIF